MVREEYIVKHCCFFHRFTDKSYVRKKEDQGRIFFHIRVEFELQLPAAAAFHQWKTVASIGNGFEGQEEERLPRQWLDKWGLSLDQEDNLKKNVSEQLLPSSPEDKNGVGLGEAQSDLQYSVNVAIRVKVVLTYIALVL